MAVQWDLIGTNGPIDISPSSGTVYFGVGVDNGYIEFNVIQDDISEFLEMFHVQLINVTGGGRLSTLGDTVAVISIQVYNTFTVTDMSNSSRTRLVRTVEIGVFCLPRLFCLLACHCFSITQFI